MTDLVTGEDGKARCRWGSTDELYRAYHDDEWGRPVTDERGLYEKLCLECLQSGLSWALILRKRDGIREALAGFAPDAVAGSSCPSPRWSRSTSARARCTRSGWRRSGCSAGRPARSRRSAR